MRPVNLIPPEDRGRGVRTAPIAYMLVGALALGLGAVTMMVLTDNKIVDRKAEIAGLGEEKAALALQADQLSPFTQFSEIERQRTTTIKSLADSRFDWERVMRELALVLPDDVSLTSLTASASGADAGSSATPVAGASGTPSLSLNGCANGHEGVAGFLGALRDIDGVTRVDLSISDRGGEDVSLDTGAATSGCGADAQFQITAAFEAAPAAASSAAPTTTAPTTTAPTTEGSTPSATESAPASATTDQTAAGS